MELIKRILSYEYLSKEQLAGFDKYKVKKNLPLPKNVLFSLKLMILLKIV